MKYESPLGSTNPNAGYIQGNPDTETQGSCVPAQAIEYPMREIINTILAADIIPSDDDLTQLLQAIELLGRIPFCLDQGSVNSIVIDPIPVLLSYPPVGSSAVIYAIRVAFTNTGNTVVNVSGLGTKALLRQSGAQLSPNDLAANGIILVSWDGIEFQLLSVPQSLAYPGPDSLLHWAQDTSTNPNVIIAQTEDDVGDAWSNGLVVIVRIANTSTDAASIVLNGFPSIALSRTTGGGTLTNDLYAGGDAWLIYDEFSNTAQLLNPQATATGVGLTSVESPYWFSVNSIAPTSPPGAPTLGDAYLVPVGASGGWAGEDGQISQWNGSAWVHRAYPASSIIGAADTKQFYENVGSNVWQEVQIPSLGKLFFYSQL